MLVLLSQVFGAAVVASPRPAMVVFVCQLVLGVLHRLGHVELPPAMRWSVSLIAMGFGLAATLLELLTQHTEEIEEVLREFNLDKVFGGLGASIAGVLLFAAYTVGDEARREDVAEAVRVVAEADLVLWQQGAIVGGAVLINVVLVWARGRIVAWLDDIDLKGWWTWLETGGVPVALFMIVLFPTVTLVLLSLLATVTFGFAVAGKLVGWTVDKALRSPCPSCDHPVRDEALGCPSCGRALTPRRYLGPKPATKASAEPA